MDRVMKGVIGVVGGVIGLVIIQEVIDDEFTGDGLADTVVSYIVPLLALALLAGAVSVWRFR